MAPARRSLPEMFRHYLLNPAALAYLALVGAVGLWIAVDTLFIEHADASFAGVWLFFVTAPTSLLFTTVSGPMAWFGVVFGAVVQAVALGALYRWFAGRSQGDADAGSVGTSGA
ncbi:SCO4225 family membrane protein [Streptomyces sp. NPDC059255]|uniref:SCO4225 family membrane protein n=1 Tax=Streptomyces sp. NPDC059255 TaxID=3346793 RepID=UPI0036A88E8A